MTVIAWDGKSIVADKRSCNNFRAATVTKLHRVGGDRILAVSGDLAKGLELVKWVGAGMVPGDLPAFQRTQDYVPLAMWVRGSGIWIFEDSAVPFHVEEPVWAGGSGRDYALAAMHLGCDARRAAEVACELSFGCGNGLDVMRFE